MNEIIKSECLEEVQLSYKSKVKPSERPKIGSSEDAHQALRAIFPESKIEHVEMMVVLLLNRANKVIGWYLVSQGSSEGTLLDIKSIMQSAILANACGIIISHNHPSGNLQPSQQDITMTKKLKESSDLFGIKLLDHVIITAEHYRSFADEGLIFI